MKHIQRVTTTRTLRQIPGPAADDLLDLAGLLAPVSFNPIEQLFLVLTKGRMGKIE